MATAVRVVGVVKGGVDGEGTLKRGSERDTAVQIGNPGSALGATEFAFDACVWSEEEGGSTNERLFEAACRPLLDALAEGFNASLIAYGETGSGKTRAILGTAEDPGLLRRTMRALCADDALVHLHVSYVEIYDNKAYDLLGEGGAVRGRPRGGSTGAPPSPSKARGGGGAAASAAPCRVRENPEAGPFVEGTETLVLSGPDAAGAAEVAIQRGELRRRVARTHVRSGCAARQAAAAR